MNVSFLCGYILYIGRQDGTRQLLFYNVNWMTRYSSFIWGCSRECLFWKVLKHLSVKHKEIQNKFKTNIKKSNQII